MGLEAPQGFGTLHQQTPVVTRPCLRFNLVRPLALLPYDGTARCTPQDSAVWRDSVASSSRSVVMPAVSRMRVRMRLRNCRNSGH